jgi:hypothetical protein
MSSSSSRPVYVPRKSRRGRGRGAFTGAFTGGFSAGYFNTVGSAEGWQPQQQQQRQQPPSQSGVPLSLHDDDLDNHDNDEEEAHPRIQRPEDFMDEQDHDEWGGPVAVQRDYRDSSSSTTTGGIVPHNKPLQSLTDVLWSIDKAPENVGRRLLRLLGWREGQSTAYVPAEESTSREQMASAAANLGGDDAPLEENKVLSQKRLRKIELQQKRVHIPSPKLDTCGLGYEPYLNAPEFKRHQERRRKLAQERAQPGRSVYRVSNVLGGDVNDDDNDGGDGPTVVHPKSGDREADGGDPYVSYETVEDFVGSKSVGGFALREDEDDAYDDQLLTKVSGKVRVDKEAFDTVAYEHESDDESADAKHENDAIDFGGALSSWAANSSSSNPTATATDTNPTSQGVTADGRSPLTGFCLGGASLPNQNQRFRGPDLPENYQVKRHVFGPDEHPLVLKAVSRAVQLEVADERKQEALQEALDANARSNRPTRVAQPVGPMAGTAFVGLAEAMKNRFTASRISTETETGDQTLVPGLSHAEPGGSSGDTAPPTTTTNTAADTKPDIKITRTIVPFAPESLLCKRLGVVRPKNIVVASIDDRTTEESYFQQEILKKAGVAASTSTTERRKSSRDDVLASLNEAEVPPEAKAERPPMAIYKSIFEPESASSESEGEATSDEDKEEKAGTIAAELARSEDSAKASPAPAPGHMEESQMVACTEPKGSAEQAGDKSGRSRSRRRSRSAEDSSDDTSDGGERRKRRKKDSHKERRHHRDEKKKKKKKKSSKRKHEYK